MNAPVTDPKARMLDELQAKANLLMRNAVGPVVSEVGKNYGREGCIAFCAAMQQVLALEAREAFGSGIAFEILKQVLINVGEAHQEAQHEQMMDSAQRELLKKVPLQ